jgi:uncharacterized oligopeptide transporter (OPT) family protein
MRMTNGIYKYNRVDVVFYRTLFGLIIGFMIAGVYGFVSGEVVGDAPGSIFILLVTVTLVILNIFIELVAGYIRELGVPHLKRKLKVLCFLVLGDVDRANAIAGERELQLG